jgi:hypothetical protein
MKLENWERPAKELEPWPKAGSAGNASWKPYAPEGAKAKISRIVQTSTGLDPASIQWVLGALSAGAK